MNTTKLGNDFAEEIADLYKLMGYEVSLNVDMDGQQIDIFTSINIAGGGLYKQIVECKYKSNNTSVSNDDVQSIASAFAVSKLLNNVTSCVIVTNSNFSLKAKQVAEKAGVFLKTKDDLIYELIDFRKYLQKVVNDFNDSFTLNNKCWYIQSYVKVDDNNVVGMADYLNEWLNSERKQPIVIKGSYGSGKSSFCSYYSYKLITSQTRLIPIIIQLRDYQRAIKIENVIRDFLNEACDAQMKYDAFVKMFNKGNILIFFDGFDEMAAKVDQAVLELNLSEIEKFSKKGNVVLTCRPEYFVSEKEEKSAWGPDLNYLSDRLSKYQVAELQEWKIEQVKEYVEKRLHFENEKERIPQCIEAIEKLPELSDLSTRAVHLELIVKMLPIMFRENIPINRPNLYQTYIGSELMREVVRNKRLRLITDNERYDLMKEIAAINHLYDLPINFEHTLNVIHKFVDVSTSELEAITRDFLNRSFLIRKGDAYFFAHKSIAEFLVAVKIKEQILLNNFEILSNNYSNTTAAMAIEMLGGFENPDKVASLLKIEHKPAELSKEMFHKYCFFAIGSIEFLIKVSKCNRYTAMIAHDDGGQLAVSLRLYRSLEKKFELKEEQQRLVELWNSFYKDLELLKNYHVNELNGTYRYIQNKEMISLVDVLQLCIMPFPSHDIRILKSNVVMFVDKEIVRRIFGNIISNAVRSMGENGTLRIRTIHKKHFLEKVGIRIFFENNGPGIPDENIQKIFEFGFTTREKDGNLHGLGLYIVKELLNEIGGDVSVYSTSELTTFVIDLNFEPVENKSLRGRSLVDFPACYENA